MKKILLTIFIVLSLLIGLIVVLHNYGFIFFLSSYRGCTVATSDGHWIEIIDSKTAYDLTMHKNIPVSRLKLKKIKIMGCQGGI